MSRFDKLTNRQNTYSVKWNGPENELPMWVADMDFETVPEVIEALKERAAHGIFGYNDIPNEWAESISKWWNRRHNYLMEEENIMFCTGVVAAISSIVRKITQVAENVVVLTPVYNIFFNSIVNNGRNILESPLVYKDEKYSIDFVDLEEKLKNPQTSMMILCNPHNPIGYIWPKETLAKIGQLCKKYNVVVLSDEIHCDITDPGCQYIPFASVDETCKNISITCSAPTKTFNLAGLHTAFIYCANPVLKHKVWRGINTDEVAEANTFALTAAINAYTYGDYWLDELREYLYKNKQDVIERLHKELGYVDVVSSNATYLLWLDCSSFTKDTKEVVDFIKRTTGLKVTYGGVYGDSGKHFIRMNIACPNERVHDGITRFVSAVKKYVSDGYDSVYLL